MARDVGVVTILSEAGADIYHRIQQEKTILHEGLHRLTVYGRLIWQGSCTGSLQLMEQWKKLIQLLLDKGINATTTDVHGRTALSMAESRVWAVMVNILKVHNP